jgi:hypothetical protein
MQTPSSVASLDLEPASDSAQVEGLATGESLQKIVRYDLKEEGNHILAVSVSYTETRIGTDAQAASGRVRTFRKLYQFVAQPCLSVRTKASELPPLEVDNKSLGPYGKTRLLRFALEAQLENVGDGAVVVKVSISQHSTASSLLSLPIIPHPVFPAPKRSAAFLLPASKPASNLKSRN